LQPEFNLNVEKITQMLKNFDITFNTASIEQQKNLSLLFFFSQSIFELYLNNFRFLSKLRYF